MSRASGQSFWLQIQRSQVRELLATIVPLGCIFLPWSFAKPQGFWKRVNRIYRLGRLWEWQILFTFMRLCLCNCRRIFRNTAPLASSDLYWKATCRIPVWNLRIGFAFH
jgi:hypothetical protein